MSVQERSTRLAYLGGLGLIGASWFWAARTTTQATNQVEASLRKQSAVIGRVSEEIERLSERVDALDETCGRAARSGATAVSVPSGTSVLSDEELDRLSAAVATRVAEASAPAAAVEPTPESLAAMEDAQKVVVIAVEAKHWTEADRQQMRTFASQMTGDQILAVRRQLGSAINRQEVRLDFRGPVF